MVLLVLIEIGNVMMGSMILVILLLIVLKLILIFVYKAVFMDTFIMGSCLCWVLVMILFFIFGVSFEFLLFCWGSLFGLLLIFGPITIIIVF